LNKAAKSEEQFTLPRIPISFHFPFLSEMEKIFEKEPNILELDGHL
jgi:hypothetical protein